MGLEDTKLLFLGLGIVALGVLMGKLSNDTDKGPDFNNGVRMNIKNVMGDYNKSAAKKLHNEPLNKYDNLLIDAVGNTNTGDQYLREVYIVGDDPDKNTPKNNFFFKFDESPTFIYKDPMKELLG